MKERVFQSKVKGHKVKGRILGVRYQGSEIRKERPQETTAEEYFHNRFARGSQSKAENCQKKKRGCDWETFAALSRCSALRNILRDNVENENPFLFFYISSGRHSFPFQL